MTTNGLAWVPDACSLPTAERPLRLAEFDELFATALRRVEPVTATHARLHLAGAPGLTATVRDLAARETECCSFFRFAVTPGAAAGSEALTLDIEVPAKYADVLAALITSAGDRSPPASSPVPARPCWNRPCSPSPQRSRWPP